MTRFLLFFLFLSAILSAQDRNLQGTVIDAATGEPLSFVYVFLQSDQSYGVITNERGEYQISLREDQLTDQLTFSLMSYQPHSFPLQNLEPEQTYYNVQMSTSFLELAEVVVISDIGLRAIVRETLENIPSAYGADDYLLKAYYRRYDIDNGEYAQLIDAMLTIRDKRYLPMQEKAADLRDSAPPIDNRSKAWVDEFRLSDYTGNGQERFQSRKAKQHALLAGYHGAVNSVRRHEIHWINSIMGIDSMEFTNRGEYLEGQDTLIRIAYSLFPTRKKDNARTSFFKALFSGELLINLSDKAILRNTLGDLDRGYYTDVRYQKHQGKYYLKQISKDGHFRYDSLRQKHQYNYLLYVTDVVTDRKAIKKYRKGNRINPELTVEDIRTPYRPAYWAKNEIIQKIPAPEALELGISRMRSLEEQFLDNARRIKRDTMKK